MNKWLAAFGAIQFVIIGVLITLIALGRLDISEMKFDTEIPIYEMLSILTQCLLFGAGFWTVLATIKSSNNQKKQWLNDSFIKHEAKLLIEFKDKTNTLYDIVSFIGQFYRPQKYAFSPIQKAAKEDRKKKGIDFKKSKFLNNYNLLCEINDFYNKNQNIFKKHDLVEGMSALVLILKSLQHIDVNDLEYELTNEQNELLIFKFKRWLQINSTFCFSAKIEIDGFDFENINNNNLDYEGKNPQEIDQYIEELSEKYVNEISNRIYSMISKVDNKTTYYDSEEELKQMAGRQFHYFLKKDLPDND